jgi:signal transduction histidine kinase
MGEWTSKTQQSNLMNLKGNLSSIFRRGIRRSMVLWGLALFGIALGLNTLTGEIYMRRQIHQSTGVMQKEVASLTARHVQAYIAQKTLRLRDAATNLSLHALGSKEQRIIISLLVKNDQSFEEISVLDSQGKERLRVSDLKVYFDADLRDLRNNIAFETAVKVNDYVSPVYTSDRAEPYLFLAVPITNPTKSSVEVVLAKSSMRFLWELVQKESFGRAGIIYIVNENGRLIAYKDPLRVIQSPDLRTIPAVAEFLRTRSKNETPAITGRGLSGSDVVSTFAVVPGLNWAVVVEEPVEFALQDIRALERFTRWLLAAGLLVGFILIIVLSNRVTRPILKLREGAVTIGAGNLDYRVDVQSKDEIGELAAQFNQMANTIKASQDLLETRVQQRTRELSLLYGVTTQINQSLELTNVLNYGIDQIAERFHFDSIRFLLFDEPFENLTLAASNNSAETDDVGPFRKGESLVGQVAERGKAVIFEDTHLDPEYQARSRSKTAYRAGFHFLAALPVKTKSQVLGVAVFSSKQPQKLADENVKLLNAICEQIAIAVEKTRLFKEVTERSEALAKANLVLKDEVVERERAQAEVSRQHRRIQALHQIGTSINRTLDLNILLENLFSEVESLFSNAAISVCLADPITGRLAVAGQRNLEPELWVAPPENSHDSHAAVLNKMTMERKIPTAIANFALDSRLAQTELWKNYHWGAYVGLPLMAEERVLGVLGFYLREQQNFTDEEIEFLSTLAGSVAVAIYNSELYEQTRQQAEDLEEANKSKDEFLNVMSHELRTPLNVVTGYAQVLDEGVLGEITTEQRHAVHTIIFQSRELLRMINEVLQVGSLQAGKVRVDIEDTNLNELFQELSTTCGVLSKKGIALLWDVPSKLPIVRTDGDKIKHILQNLIHNALKFTEEGSVTVSARCLPSAMEFKVADTGVGITDEMLPVIFEMFRQVDSSKTRSYGGAGVGLFIVNRFIELLGGKITVASSLNKGTTFTITIPAPMVSKQPSDDTPSEDPLISTMAL